MKRTSKKVCPDCGRDLPHENFYENPSRPDGLASECKDCAVHRTRVYSRTPAGIVTTTYSNQKQRSKDRGHIMPLYSREELLNYMVNHSDFKSLYEAWIKSGYRRNLKPSIDRLDDDKPYSLDNIRLVTAEENLKAAGKNNSKGKYKMSKKVLVKFPDGSERVFPTCNNAAKELGHSSSYISNLCNKKVEPKSIECSYITE